jgi:hypothetical protein
MVKKQKPWVESRRIAVAAAAAPQDSQTKTQFFE